MIFLYATFITSCSLTFLYTFPKLITLNNLIRILAVENITLNIRIIIILLLLFSGQCFIVTTNNQSKLKISHAHIKTIQEIMHYCSLKNDTYRMQH